MTLAQSVDGLPIFDAARAVLFQNAAGTGPKRNGVLPEEDHPVSARTGIPVDENNVEIVQPTTQV